MPLKKKNQAITIKSLIIDDDPFIINLLTDKLALCCPEVQIIATAKNGQEGYEKIVALNPELIFLDVEMDDMTGFEMLSKVKNISFQTIFITSFAHYAIKAIRFNALDYLVKPINLGELKRAIHRYKENVKNLMGQKKLVHAINNLQSKNFYDQVLTLNTHEGEMNLQLNEIIKIKGERNYSTILLTKDRKKLSSKSLGEFEELLYEKGFYRCHRSYLINFFHIESIQNGLNLLLSDNSLLPVSRRKKVNFLEWYEKF